MGYWACIIEQSISYFKYNKKQQVIIVLLIAILSFLSGSLFLLHKNLMGYFGKKDEYRVIIYWNHADKAKIFEQVKKIKNIKGVNIKKLYSPEDAIKILTQGDVPTTIKHIFEHNSPIPYTAILSINLKYTTFSKAIKKIKALPFIKGISYDSKKLDIYTMFMKTFKYIEVILVGIFVFISISLIFLYYSVLKLTRLKELYILYLTGASKSFLIIPFIIHSAVLGFFSITLSMLLLKICQFYLNSILYAPPIWINIDFFSNMGIFFQMLSILSLSIIGSFLAAYNVCKKTFNKEF